jgi:hypothetical protein
MEYLFIFCKEDSATCGLSQEEVPIHDHLSVHIWTVGSKMRENWQIHPLDSHAFFP